MRHFKFFDGNFAFVQPATNLRLIGALQPQFDCFFDHFFRVLRRFTLTDDAEFGQFATYQPSSPGSITAVSFGSFIIKSLPRSASLRQ